jgi:hypothetical protein
MHITLDKSLQYQKAVLLMKKSVKLKPYNVLLYTKVILCSVILLAFQNLVTQMLIFGPACEVRAMV